MVKVTLASTVAAMLGVTQAAAAAMGTLTVWTTADGLIDIPEPELAGVGIVTVLVAVALGVGSARTLTGKSSRLLAVANLCSLVISAYWGVVRPAADGFPVIPISYAAVSVLGLGLLAVSGVLSRHHHARSRAADDVGTSPPGTAPPVRPPNGPAELPDQAAEVPDQAAERPDRVPERPAWA